MLQNKIKKQWNKHFRSWERERGGNLEAYGRAGIRNPEPEPETETEPEPEPD